MIVHINGWPGVGKYTIGKELSKKLGARFIHNHLLHDISFACAGRGDEDRWPLYEKVRLAAYDVLERRPASETFVMTNALCYGVDKEVEAWSKVVDLAISRSALLIPVILRADTETIARRVSSNNRLDMKLKDPVYLREMVSKYSLQVPDVPEVVEVEVSKSSAEEAADEILFRVKEAANSAKPASAQHKLLK